MNGILTSLVKSMGMKGVIAAGLLGLSPTAALAHDHDRGFQFDIHLPLRAEVYIPAPPPVERREERVWVEPVYQTVSDRQWIEPVYQTVVDRVWVPEHREDRDFVRYGRVVHRERIFVPGHYEDLPHQVLACEGHWQQVERQELLSPGHWETRIEAVPAPYWPR
jgi:hypothetical protein